MPKLRPKSRPIAAGNHDARCNIWAVQEFATNDSGACALVVSELEPRRFVCEIDDPRSMTDGSASIPPKPLRSAKRRLMFVLIAGALAIVGALTAGYYFAVRPVTLRRSRWGQPTAMTSRWCRPSRRPSTTSSITQVKLRAGADRGRQRQRADAGRRQGRSRASSAATSTCRKTRKPSLCCARMSW